MEGGLDFSGLDMVGLDWTKLDRTGLDRDRTHRHEDCGNGEAHTVDRDQGKGAWGRRGGKGGQEVKCCCGCGHDLPMNMARPCSIMAR